MKRLMLFLALGLASTEKLDRTYLPPPGSKYAGGEPGDLQVPLEFPKQAYTTTAPVQPGQNNNEPPSFQDSRLVPGSLRRPGQDFSGTTAVTPSSKLPFNYFQSKVPTTTTSYAFTQTTTFSPESFETTLSPIFPNEGALGEQPGFINQPFSQEQIFNQKTIPSFVQPSNQLSQRPGFLPISNVSGVQTSFPGSQNVPIYTQAQSNNQNQPIVPVSTASPIPGTSLQPGIVTSPQGYTQHLGVQPPRQFNQQGYSPSSTVAPGFETDFPSQYKGDISNIQATKFNGQQPSKYPTNGTQGYSPSSTPAPGYQTGFTSQNGDLSYSDTTKFNGQPSSGYPTNSPQHTTQYIDKYGNLQNNIVPGLNVPHQHQQSQSPFHRPGLTQYRGDFNSIPGQHNSIIPPQQGQNLQSVGPQESQLSNIVSHETSNTGLTHGQQQGTARPQYFDQNGPYLTSTPSQGTNVLGMFGTQQQGSQQGPYLPTTSSGGIPINKGYQNPQFVNQQSNFPSSGISQSTPLPGTLGSQSQRNQRPEFGTQENIYSSSESPQKLYPETLSQGGQQQIGGQQGLYPSTFIPGQETNQQGGRPQFIGQQGAIIPGQFNNQQPESHIPQFIAQQNSLPYFVGASQRPSIPGETNTQHSQLSPQSFQTPGSINQGENVNNAFKIPPGSNAPGQQQYIGKFPGSKPIPFGQPQTTDSRIISQQSKPGDQRVPDGSLNIDRPVTAASPSSYQQPIVTSTTPSSIQSYGTTPGRVYPSSTSLPAVNDLRGRRPGIIISRPERPQADSDRNAVILNYENILTPEGFAYSFDTSNGIHADENGTAIDGVKANGSYSYIGDDGKLYSVVYTADENGFRPHGDHLPTPPPVPKAIQRVIEQATKDKEAGISHDGFYDDKKYGHKKYQSPKYRRPVNQDKVNDGQDNENGYKKSYNDRDFKKKHRPNTERQEESTYGKHPLDKYDNNRYDTDDDNTEINMDGNIEKQDNRKSLLRQPTYKKPEQNEYEHEHDLSPQPEGQDSKRKRPFSQDEDSPKRHPSSSSHKGKPVFSKEQYDDGEEYDEKKYAEEGEEFITGPEADDRRIPTKTSGTKYSDFEGDSQQTDDDKRQFPGHFNTKEKSDNEVIKGGKRPTSHGTQTLTNSYDLKQTTGKGTRLQKPIKGASKTSSGTKYQASDDGSSNQQDYEEPKFYEQSNQDIVESKKMGPTYNRNEFTYKQKPGINYQENTFDNVNYPAGSKSKQKGQASYNQQHNVNANRNSPEQSDNEATGYHYIPPQNKFDQGADNRFPSRFSDKAMTKKPGNKYQSSNKKTTAQPFITPNVHRDEDGSYEDVSEENSNLKDSEKMTSRIPEYKTTEDSSEYFNEQNEPEQQYDEEDDSSGKIYSAKPGKTTSVYRPGYQSQHTTRKPEYYDDNTSKKMSRPGSRTPESDRRPFDIGEESTEERLDQGYLEETREMSKNPNSIYTSSTTPISSRKPNRPVDKKTLPPGQTQYSTTYEPSDTSSTEEDYYEGSTVPTYTKTKSSKRPLTTSSRVTNTTPTAVKDNEGSTRIKVVSSKPTYNYSSDGTLIPESPTIRPGISESTFDRPSGRPGGSRKPSYSTTTLRTTRPDYTVDYDMRNPEAGLFYSEQGETNYPEKNIKGSETPVSNISQNFGQSGRKDVPSTTYRPNYSITTISQPGSVALDTFGRPLQPVSQSGATQTGLSEPPNQGSPSNVYQDAGVIRPEQGNFKPSEARFGGPVQGFPGQKPAAFGPSSFTTPGYLQPYGPSTGKIIGEDFSGPKQQQKYDPETGYYY